MRRRLPLNSVRAFEAAGRHLSLARAAIELNVTPTAVSHHLRALEDFLQTRLFDRGGGLALTKEGRMCLDGLTDGFDRLELALSSLVERKPRAEVVVRLATSFALLWLGPRLHDFFARHPDIDVSLVATHDHERFGDGDIDIGIRYTRGQHANRKVERLMEEVIMPVCAPSLLPDRQPVSPRDLAELPLVHDDTFESVHLFPDWRRYFDLANVRPSQNTRSIRFNESCLAVQNAVAGHGVLLGRSRLIADALATGSLVAATRDPYPMKFYYYVVSRGGAASPAAAIFLKWLSLQVDSL